MLRKFFFAFTIIAIALGACGPIGAEPTVTPTTTQASTATPAPELEAVLDDSISPEEFLGDSNIIIHFNQPMDPDSVDQPLVLIPHFSGKYRWSDNNTTLTFVPDSAISGGYIIQVRIASGLASAVGETFGFTPKWVLRTPKGPAAATVTRSPETYLDPDAPSFQLTFNVDVDLDSVEKALSVKPDVDLAFSWEKENVLTVFVRDVVTPESFYEFTLSDKVIVLDGREFREKTWAYQGRPFRVLSFESPEKSTRKSPFVIHFSYPTDSESFENDIQISPEFSYELEWEADNRIVSIVPLEGLQPAKVYEFNLPASVQAESGAVLDKQYSWSYALPPLIDSFRQNDEKLGDAPLVIKFNYSMDTASVEEHLRILPEANYTLNWEGENTVLQILPETYWPTFSTYTVYFEDDILDASGESLTDPGLWTFTIPPPKIVFDPKTNEYSPAPSNWPMTLTFDRPMDQESTIAAISISPAIEGEFTWESEFIVQFVPEAGEFASQVEYEVTLSTAALDRNGFPIIAEPATWQFITIDYDASWINFGEMGARVQVVDLEGDRAIEVSDRDDASVHFQLYELTVSQFLNLDFNEYRSYGGGPVRNDPFNIYGTRLVKEWDSEEGSVNLPEDVESGIYVLNMITDRLNDQLLVIASHSTISVEYTNPKNGGGQIMAWVSNINGGVMPDAEISVYDIRGNELLTGTTDEIGVFVDELPAGARPYLVVSRRGDDITLTGISRVWETLGRYSYYGWWVSSGRGIQHPENIAYIYTERPIYKPGQTVNFKGIVRRDDDVEFSLLHSGYPIEVEIRDARGNLLETQTYYLNSFGSFNGSFEIAEGGNLGEYSIVAMIAGSEFEQIFKVEDYKKPDIDVQINTDAADYVVGDEITIEVEANYLFGEPLSQADVTVNWYPLGYYSSGANTSKTKLLVTDGNGYATATFEATMHYDGPYYNSPSGDQWAIEVSVDDGSNQEVSTFSVVTVYEQAAEINLEIGGFLYAPEENFTVQASLSSIFDSPIADQELKLTASRYVTYRNWNVITTQEIITDANGNGMATLALEEGWYKLEVTGKDNRKTPISDSRWVWIHDFKGSWRLDYSSDMSIYLERDTYEPGSMARVMIASAFDGQALLTLERGTIHEERIVQLTAPVTVVEVPIRADYAPNIYVVVQAWNDVDSTLDGFGDSYGHRSIPESILRVSTANISVPDSAHELDVVITSDQDVYQPREEATFDIQVTNQQGEGVQAELSLALVDEAIFKLSDDLAEPIHDAFFFERRLAIRQYNSMAPWRGLEGGVGGGGGDGGPQFGGSPRSDFPDTVIWEPVVLTDKDGKAHIKVQLPDTLTSWRLTVKAVTQTTEVGESQHNIITQQPVVVRPMLPRTLVSGDAFTLAAMVHNYSDEELELDVYAASEAFGLDGEESQTLSLAVGESRIVTWDVQALEPGDGDITFWALSDEYSDAIEVSIPIQPFVVPYRAYEAGRFVDELVTSINVPENPYAASTVEVELSGSVAGSLLNGVEYLTGYPYGCVEQTMSRALPNAVVARAFHQLGMDSRIDRAGLDEKVKASIQRLYGYQHGDGGWGWWYDDDSDAYQTAWVVYGLVLTKQAGYDVEDEVIAGGVEFLDYFLDEMDFRTKVYALYSMAIAGYGDLAETREMVSYAATLDAFSNAALAQTLYLLGDQQRANAILDQIIRRAEVLETGEIYWSGDEYDGYYSSKTMSSDTRSTAMVLQALLVIDPEHEYRQGITAWLLNQRQGFGWGTTNETAFTLVALSDQMSYERQSSADAEYTIFVNGEAYASGGLDSIAFNAVITIPIADLKTGENAIRLTSSASLYYLIHSKIYLDQEEIEPDGILIYRQYLEVDKEKRVDSVEEGQLVRVRVKITLPEDGFYIMVEDHLPGGLEALNEGLNTTARVFDPGYYVGYYYEEYASYWGFRWKSYRYNNKEVYGDRVTFFITELSAGTYTYTYYARATVAGDFLVMPAEVSAMYDSTIWGRSSSDIFQVVPVEE